MKYHKGFGFKPVERLQRRGATPLRCERGSSLVEFAMVLPILLLLVLGAIDFGRAYYLSIEVANAARAGVQYGVRNSSDTAGMQTAAESDAPDVPNMTATSEVGCECLDGSNSMSPCSNPPTCTGNPVGFVEVTTNATYRPVIPWPGVPVSIPLSGQAKMRIDE